MFVQFSVKGEYDDYFGIELTEEEYKVIQKFVNEFNANVDNVSIEEIKKEYMRGQLSWESICLTSIGSAVRARHSAGTLKYMY